MVEGGSFVVESGMKIFDDLVEVFILCFGGREFLVEVDIIYVEVEYEFDGVGNEVVVSIRGFVGIEEVIVCCSIIDGEDGF